MHMGALIHAGFGRVDSCTGVHANSRGASADGNSRVGRGLEVCEETRSSSMSTLSWVWRPAVGLSSPLQQAWVGLVQSSSLQLSHGVEIGPGCVATVSHLPIPDFAFSSPGCSSEVRRWLGWTLVEKTDRSGVWLFRGAFRGGGVLSALLAAGDWVKRICTIQRGRYPHFLCVLARTCTGKAQLLGHNLESGAGHCCSAHGGLSHL